MEEEIFFRSWWKRSFVNSPFIAFVLNEELSVVEQNVAAKNLILETHLSPMSYSNMCELIAVGITDQASVQASAQALTERLAY